MEENDGVAIGDKDGSTFKIQTHKRFKRTVFIRTRQNQQIFGVIPFVKLQKDTWTTAKRSKTMKNEMESFYVFGSCFSTLAVILVPDFC